MLTAERLIGWARTHDQRARQAAPTARLAVVFGILAGAGLAVAMIESGDPRAASGLWTAALVASTGLAFVTTAFRLFWSADADSLSLHPIPGSPLFRLGTLRNLRVALGFATPNLVGLGGFAILGQLEVGFRHGLLWAMAVVATTTLAPAMALLGGALAASERAEAITASIGGEFRAPRGAYLGVIPGIAGAGMILAVIFDRPWAVGADALPIASLVCLVLAPLALLVADRRSDAVMPGAVRELSAFNQRRLAYVEVTVLTTLEKLVVATVPSAIRPVVGKDLRVLRRRHPAYYLAHGAATLGVWIGALTSSNGSNWTLMALCALHLYSVVMTWRSISAPLEIRRLLAFLPLSSGQRRLAKQVPLHLRTAVITATIGSALYYQRQTHWSLIVIAASALLATVAGVIVSARSAR